MISARSGRFFTILLIAAALCACGGEPKGPAISRSPASIRGWLVDPGSGTTQLHYLTDTASGDAAQRARLFEQTNLSVEGFPYASGGMAANGAFIILDVPPGDVIINFQPPEGANAQLTIKGIPANADILLPALRIQETQVIVTNPQRIVVRVPGRVEAQRPIAGANTLVAGHPVPVLKVPLREMIDRREFPEPR